MTTAMTAGWVRTRVELLQYFREKESVFFSFTFPILMLVLFSTIFAGQFQDGGQLNAARAFLPGMLSAGVLLTSFQTMAMSVAVERDDGTLKRLRSTPMPPVSYFLGKVGLVLLTSIAQAVVLLLVARFGYGVVLPTSGSAWLTFGWVFLLGIVSGTTLGVAWSSLATARSAGAVVIAPVLILQFISGVYFTFSSLPTWLQHVASVFPLKWIAQGMRSVFYPETMASMEMTGSWEHGRTALILLAWTLIGLFLCVRTFRWFKRGTV